jgi:DNA polymerase V
MMESQSTDKLDLVKTLVPSSPSTFFFRVDGISMPDDQMDEGDILVVDRAVDPYNDCRAVCFLDGEFTVKRVDMTSGSILLVPCNENNTRFKPVSVSPDDEHTIWGVVTWVIKKV